MSELMEEQTGIFEQTDIDNNKTIAGLAYFIFFLPLLSVPSQNSPGSTLTRHCSC